MPTTLIPIKTKALNPPREDLFAVLSHSLVENLQEGDVVVITSKIVAIHQGRCIPITSAGAPEKQALIEKEADRYISGASSKYGITLAITNSALIPSAGIDESNGNGYYILLPQDPSKAAREIAQFIKSLRPLKKLGIIISDSHCTPLRRGVTGIAIGSFGIAPLHDYRGQKDIFGRPFHFSQTNIVDAIAAAAVGIMGEGNELTPLVIVRDWPRITYAEQATFTELTIDPDEDIFAPLLAQFKKSSTR
jgi:dihydrofolate synthase / folylpolyglutamate synthase